MRAKPGIFSATIVACFLLNKKHFKDGGKLNAKILPEGFKEYSATEIHHFFDINLTNSGFIHFGQAFFSRHDFLFGN